MIPPGTCQLLASRPKNCAQTLQDDLISWALQTGLGKPPEMLWVFPGSTEQEGPLCVQTEGSSSPFLVHYNHPQLPSPTNKHNEREMVKGMKGSLSKAPCSRPLLEGQLASEDGCCGPAPTLCLSQSSEEICCEK